MKFFIFVFVSILVLIYGCFENKNGERVRIKSDPGIRVYEGIIVDATALGFGEFDALVKCKYSPRGESAELNIIQVLVPARWIMNAEYITGDKIYFEKTIISHRIYGSYYSAEVGIAVNIDSTNAKIIHALP